jgi:hypothetical protein
MVIDTNKYQNSKIYKLVSPHTNSVYIGSTCRSLETRLKEHISNYNKWISENKNKGYITSFELLKHRDVNIVLLETFSCNNKYELYDKERYHIEQNLNNIVNKIRPNRTPKEYYQDNIIIIKLKKREKHICQCGGRYCNDHLCHHIKSKKHINWIQQNENQSQTLDQASAGVVAV